MALIHCKECQKEISSTAAQCPHCGYANKTESSGRNIVIGVILVMIMLSLIPSCIRSTEKQPQAAQPTANNANNATTPPQPEAEKPPTWTYRKSTDDMTGKPIIAAITESLNTHTLGWPYGITSASVLIRKHPQHGSDVIIALSDGQILCNAYDNCTISIRFDDRKPIKLTASTPADHSSKTLFLPAASFVREAKTAQRMKISVPLYQNGEIMFDFDISGLEWPPKVASKTAAR